eukprot:CAMPEP_0172419500 /NCGR_PEP_ID=MMETSP1064-20121228/5925_1 /TAXON_ID=202472 /ORGANISM="Aulacoseira subarctica , Strain CCAP 1002/5" /LENGTH=194 /DNA_ID=CAMNT_0013159013 /DNA_START=463 /DNA_END=1047 /DNA_ORIENTATION=+
MTFTTKSILVALFLFFGQVNGQPKKPVKPAPAPVAAPVAAPVSSVAYAQVSSTKNQTNAAIGTGAALTCDSIDALSGIGFTSGGTQFTINTAGAYFLIAAIQVGFGGGCASTVTSYTADYWVAVNGVAVSNSNVRLVAPSTSTDVIVTQGVYIFNKGDKVTIVGSGKCSISVVINPGGSEPLIPSIIATLYKID